MSQGKDKTLFTLTSAHDPTTTEAPRIGNTNVRFRDIWFRRNYQRRVRYPISWPLPTRPFNSNISNASSNSSSNTSSNASSSASSLHDANLGNTSNDDNSLAVFASSPSPDSRNQLRDSLTSSQEATTTPSETTPGALLLVWDSESTDADADDTALADNEDETEDSGIDQTPRLLVPRNTSIMRTRRFRIFRRSSRA